MSNTNAAIVPTVGQGQRLDVFAVDKNLSLQNGMTAGYGVNDGHNDNWPFAPGQYGRWPFQPNRVGFIRNTTSLTGTPSSSSQNPAGLYTLYFMYNPNQIQISWATNPGQTAPLYLYGTDASNALSQIQGAAGQDNAAVPNLANTQSIGWSLYFDRTYDMMYGNNEGAAGPPNPMDDRGVLKDVAALYNLMGTFLTDAAVPISVPCEVVFGQNGAGQLFGFTGYITSLTITYGIFRHDMIPSRAEVDIQMTCTYVSNQVPTSSATGAAPNSAAAANGSLGNSLGNGPPVSTIPQSAFLGTLP